MKVAEILPFTRKELIRARGKIKERKAPGPNILAEAIKAIVKGNSHKVQEILNHLLKTGTLPQEWKVVRLSSKNQIGIEQRRIQTHLLNLLGKFLECL